MLRMTLGNSKLKTPTLIFNLPAGHCCPFAKDCFTCADRKTGKITDGKDQKFRCFGASAECRYPALRKLVWSNYDQISACKSSKQIYNLINESIPKNNYGLFRIHATGGDFFSRPYFNAWKQIALDHPNTLFYAYSKAISVVTWKDLPDNMKIIASRGGKQDHLIDRYKLRSVRVVFTQKEADDLGLEVDHDDTHVWNYNKDFALLIHGVQQKNSRGAKVLAENRKTGGFVGYHFMGILIH